MWVASRLYSATIKFCGENGATKYLKLRVNKNIYDKNRIIHENKGSISYAYVTYKLNIYFPYTAPFVIHS